MKKARTILKAVIWSLISLYVMMLVVIRIPAVQKTIGNEVAGMVGEKLGTKVTVGKVNLGMLNRVVIDDVTIYDQSDTAMIKAARMAAKIDVYTLLTTGNVAVSSAQLFGFNGVFYKKDEAAKPNFQFVLDSLASEDDTPSRLKLSVNSLLIRRGSLKYDRYDRPYTSSRFNTDHLGLTDISAHIAVPYYSSDSIDVNVKKLSFKERSGFVLSNLTLDASAGKNGTKVEQLSIRLPHSDMSLTDIKAVYTLREGKLHMPSLTYTGRMNIDRLSLCDISNFVPILSDSEISLSAAMDIAGDNDVMHIRHLDIHTPDGALRLNANAEMQRPFGKQALKANVKDMYCAGTLAASLPENIRKDMADLLPVMEKAGFVGYKGTINTDGKHHEAKGCVMSGVGDINIDMTADDNAATLKAFTATFDLGKITADNNIGKIAASIDAKCRMAGNDIRQADLKADITSFEYKGYRYNDISATGLYDNGSMDATLKINDSNADIAAKGNVTKTSAGLKTLAEITVNNLNPSALRLSDRWNGSTFRLNIAADGIVSDKNPNVFNGNLSFKNVVMADEERSYLLESLNIATSNERISIDGDFGNAVITGHNAIGNLASCVKKVIASGLPSLCSDNGKATGDISIDAHLTDAEWPAAFLGIPLKLNSDVSVNASFNGTTGAFDMLCSADDMEYDGERYGNVLLKGITRQDTLAVSGALRKMKEGRRWVDIAVNARAADDKIYADLKWKDNKRGVFMGEIGAETQLLSGNGGMPDFRIRLKQSSIVVNDTVWHVKPADITSEEGSLIVNNFAIEHNKQHIRISGKATKSQEDSITIDLRDIDVNYILNLVNFHSVDFKGRASGTACVKSVFQEPKFYAALTVDDFKFEDGRMGKLAATVNWNDADKQIDIDALARDDDDGITHIYGNVSPPRNTIDLRIGAANTNIEFLESLCGSFMGDVKAKANGEVRLHGLLSSINLTGLLVADGNVRIKPLNVTYSLNNDSIRFEPDNIIFRADTVRDRNGNIGIVEGVLRHRALTRLRYDLRIRAERLLCFDTHGYGDNTFYGTAYTTGTCTIKGGGGRIDIDVDVTPQKGSFIEYNAASPEAVSNQQFVTWHNKDDVPDKERMGPEDDEDDEDDDIPSDMRINFIFNLTPEATLRVLMDKNTEDYIALNGVGNIKATYFNKAGFNMFGTYRIDHGVYKLTVQNVMKRLFQFQPGSSIVFGGDPFDAALQLKAMYTVNGVPLSDLQIGNSFSGNNVRVDCIMNIGGTPETPKVDFDIELPTLSNDAAQMVRTLINSEEEMNQQVVYLLGVGRFYIQNANNATRQPDQPSQTSLAMQSLLSGTISQQVNTLLGNLVKNENWTFGANISTGNEGFNNAEYEGLLSGRLLNNRLILNGQFGYRDNPAAATSFIGDFDVSYLLKPNGNMALKVYNQTNDRYFTKSSLNTQGIGFILKKDFNSLRDLLGIKGYRSSPIYKKRKRANMKTPQDDSSSAHAPDDAHYSNTSTVGKEKR
ncbi:MAG: translocation/assembly module TamB domain-containing protein [Prevotella sp.]